MPIVLLAHDVGEVDEGQHHPLLLHLRLLGDPKVVVAAHTQARLPQEPKEEENHLISTYLIIVTDATDAVSVNFSGRCTFLLI